MTLLYYDPRFLDHDTGRHPERPARLRHVMSHLEGTALLESCSRGAWEPASRGRIERVHAPDHFSHVGEVAARGGGMLDPDTVVSPASAEVARLAAGAATDAVDRVVRGESKNALCLVRPPGHHALPDRAMGFCLFNNVAIGARVALEEHRLDRVLVVDWDVHHGNGTQDTFYDDGRVGFLSVHRYPFYPGTGGADETGTGDGLGATCNLPLEFGIRRSEYLKRFEERLEEFSDRIRPQLVLVSAGFDAHREDPVGSLGLEVEDFATLTRLVCEVAATHAGGRIVSILEGGYNPPVLGECVEAHLRELVAQDGPSRDAS